MADEWRKQTTKQLDKIIVALYGDENVMGLKTKMALQEQSTKRLWWAVSVVGLPVGFMVFRIALTGGI